MERRKVKNKWFFKLFVVAVVCTFFQLGDLKAQPINGINTGTITWGGATTSTNYGYVTDAEYESRLYSLPTSIPLTYNKTIRSFIELYTVKKREVSQRVLGLSPDFFPLIEDVFRQYGIPDELKYLAIAESALSPNAVSRAGATGMWQFMRGTGKMYQLSIDSYMDERRDPYQATVAAARYLKDMHNRFGDWFLVIAAYNCGPGKVNSAVRRSGGKRDYWAIRHLLPRETRGYVPSFIGCMYMMNYSYEHNLVAEDFAYPFAYSGADTVRVKGKIQLDAIAEVLGIEKQLLRYLNPALKKGILPEGRRYTMRLPITNKYDYRDKLNIIQARMAESDMLANYNKAVMEASRSVSTGRIDPIIPKGKNKLVYKIKSGDNLGFIAEWYDCSTSEIRKWNGIVGNKIRAGQNLNIYFTPGEESSYKRVNDMSFDQKQAFAKGENVPANKIKTASATKTKSSSNSSASKSTSTDSVDKSLKEYTVKSGDSLWLIAKRNPNNSIESITKVNKISSKTKLQPGMILKIY